jgi:hypothetical protein
MRFRRRRVRRRRHSSPDAAAARAGRLWRPLAARWFASLKKNQMLRRSTALCTRAREAGDAGAMMPAVVSPPFPSLTIPVPRRVEDESDPSRCRDDAGPDESRWMTEGLGA